MVCRFFSLFHRLSFHFVNVFFCCAEAFQFDVVLLVYFWFCCLDFRCDLHTFYTSQIKLLLFPLPRLMLHEKYSTNNGTHMCVRVYEDKHINTCLHTYFQSFTLSSFNKPHKCVSTDKLFTESTFQKYRWEQFLEQMRITFTNLPWLEGIEVCCLLFWGGGLSRQLERLRFS